MKKVVVSKCAPSPIGPYSQAIKSNGVIYVSGQLPVNPKDGTIPEEVTEQTQQSLSNIKAILEESGYCLSDVVKATVYLGNMNDFNAMNKVYNEFFVEPYPARVAIEVAKLPKDAKVEIEVVADK